MTTLLTFRDNIKAVYSRYDYIFTPILKFILSFVIFLNINSKLGYMEALNNNFIIAAISLICAFLPLEFLAGMAFLVYALHAVRASLDGGLVGIALILIFYFGYMRFSPKSGVFVFVIPILDLLHLTYAIPIVFGFLFGPISIIPVAFGWVCMRFSEILGNLVNVSAAANEEEKVQGYQYIVNELLADKHIMLMMAVAAVVIMMVYVIYRMSFEYSWIVAFVVGGILNITLFLVGGVMLSVDVNAASIVLGSIVGVILAVIIRFFKGIVDYQRTELLQFEDEQYYYYVKAIPKLSVAEKKENIKHINSISDK